MEYCIKANISPVIIVPLSTPLAPNQMIKILTIFIINIIIGIINVITRLVNKVLFANAVFASAKRFSSCFSVEKARITGKPVKISLVTKFNRSINFCIKLNFGIATTINTNTIIKIVPTAAAIIQAISTFVFNTLITPPIPRIGA